MGFFRVKRIENNKSYVALIGGFTPYPMYIGNPPLPYVHFQMALNCALYTYIPYVHRGGVGPYIHRERVPYVHGEGVNPPTKNYVAFIVFDSFDPKKH